MTVVYSLESRSLSSGLAQRTIKNLRFLQEAHRGGADVHMVTQLVNSLLALLVFPVEKEKAFFELFAAVPLDNPPDFRAVRKLLPGFPLLPSLRVFRFERSADVKKLFRRLRNSIAHRRLEFSSDSRDLEDVYIEFTDLLPASAPDWHIALTASDVLALCLYIADEIIEHAL